MPPSPCARGCCWVPMAGVCGKQRKCACHPPTLTEWLGTRADEPAVRLSHRDPTGNQAIRNIEREQRKKGKP